MSQTAKARLSALGPGVHSIVSPVNTPLLSLATVHSHLTSLAPAPFGARYMTSLVHTARRANPPRQMGSCRYLAFGRGGRCAAIDSLASSAARCSDSTTRTHSPPVDLGPDTQDEHPPEQETPLHPWARQGTPVRLLLDPLVVPLWATHDAHHAPKYHTASLFSCVVACQRVRGQPPRRSRTLHKYLESRSLCLCPLAPRLEQRSEYSLASPRQYTYALLLSQGRRNRRRTLPLHTTPPPMWMIAGFDSVS